jgi:hypothetical protein
VDNEMNGKVLLIFFLGLLCFGKLSAQEKLGAPVKKSTTIKQDTVKKFIQPKTNVDVTLVLKGIEVGEPNVTVGYKIPFPGFVQFFLFDKNGTKIWEQNLSREAGDNKVLINKAKLNPGIDYSFEIRYKGKTYTGKIKI